MENSTILNTKIVVDPNYVASELAITNPEYIYDILRTIKHFRYTPETGGPERMRFDLALIKVSRRLPSKMEIHHGHVPLERGELCRFAGWGSVSMDSRYHSIVLAEMKTFALRLDEDVIWTRDKGGFSKGGQVF